MSRIFLVLLGATQLGLAVSILTHPTGLRSGFDLELFAILVAIVLLAACCFSICCSYIALEAEHLVIRNFWPRPRRIPYASIRAVGIGYQGLEVYVTDVRWKAYGWAVQQSNWRDVTGRPGRSQVLLQQIKLRAPNVHVPQLDQ